MTSATPRGIRLYIRTTFIQGGFDVDNGTTFSQILRGTTLPHRLAAANVSQVNLNTLGARTASNVDWLADPLNGVNHFDANLEAGGVEHTMLVWYVRGGIGAPYASDYNVLQELDNV